MFPYWLPIGLIRVPFGPIWARLVTFSTYLNLSCSFFSFWPTGRNAGPPVMAAPRNAGPPVTVVFDYFN